MMKIGVDLRVLQVGHQYRGIGEVAKRSLNGIFARAVAERADKRPSFVFYEYSGMHDPKALLDIPAGLQYEVVDLGLQPLNNPHRTVLDKLRNKQRILYGNPIPKSSKSDVLLQFDYALGVPRHPKTVLIAHDVIPYIFWNDFFTSPWVHFRHKAARTTIRTIVHNYEYKRVLRRSLRNAWKILCVSDHTRQDLVKYFHTPLHKMSVMHLGVEEKVSKTGLKGTTSAMPTKPFLLFIGAVDVRRRRIDDLIAAYNNLKAAGHDIQLVLAGENFQAPNLIPNETVRAAVLDSSYKQDILTLGYIDDATKQELYHRALAFVFPTMYEGFGIPILESMLMRCPVIVYKNSSTEEVGGKYAFYARDWLTLKQAVEHVKQLPKKQLQAHLEHAYEHARTFTWSAAVDKIYSVLMNR